MLARRLLSAAVGIPVVIALVLAGGPVYLAALALILGASVAELLAQDGIGVADPRLWSAAVATAAFAVAGRAPGWWQAGTLLALLGVTLAIWVVRAATGDATRWWLGAVLALYVGGLGRWLNLLREGGEGRSWVFFALFVTFASDTGAYAVGRLVGRHKLAPAISPAKTMEGAAGGLAGAALAAVALAWALHLPLRPVAALLLGVGVSVAAQAGDLLESALKRRLQLKDAGGLLPGHGGLLDRLDSLLFSGAMVYFVVKWMSL
jgi:phosphatidate cytidylyltransferase